MTIICVERGKGMNVRYSKEIKLGAFYDFLQIRLNCGYLLIMKSDWYSYAASRSGKVSVLGLLVL